MNLLTILLQAVEPTTAASNVSLSFLEKVAAITLFGGVGWAIAVGVIFLIAVFISDYNENGFAITLSFAGLMALFYFWGSAPLWEVFPLFSWKFLVLYFSVGLVYAILKTFLYSKKQARIASSRDSRADILRTIKRGLEENVFRWWFAWPISFTMWVFGDLLSDIFSGIWSKVRKLFENIAKAGIDAGMNSKEK